MSAGAAAIAAAAAARDVDTASTAAAAPAPADEGGYLTHDTAARSGRVALFVDPRTSQAYARSGPHGMPAYSLQRRFVAKHSGGERIGVEEPYEAMPNTQTAQQWANLIAHVLVAVQSRLPNSRCHVVDVGYNMSSTVAALLFHPIRETLLSPAQISYSLALDFYGALRAWIDDGGAFASTDPTLGLRVAVLNTTLRELESLVGSLRVNSDAHTVVSQLREAVESLHTASPVGDASKALASLMLYAAADVERGSDDKRDETFWADAFVRAAIRSCIRDAPIDFPGNSKLGAEFLTRFQASASVSSGGAHADPLGFFRGFPAFPLTAMLKGADTLNRATVFNFTLFHDPRHSLFDAAMEFLCIRLLFCAVNAEERSGSGATAIFVNDFMGRLFVNDVITASDGGFDGTQATSPLMQPPMYLRNDLARGKIGELRALAQAFALPKLAAATRRMAEQKQPDEGERSRHRVESWTAIRHAVLTTPLKGGTTLFDSCVAWMTAVRGAADGLRTSSAAALSFVVPHHAFVTHPNGMQLVRLTHTAWFNEKEGVMQKMLYSPVVPVTISDARRLDASVPAWVIGNTPRVGGGDAKDKKAAPTPVERLHDAIRRRVALAPHAAADAIRATGASAIRGALSGVNPASARGIIASQPSYRNAILAWSILDQVSGGRDPLYKTVLVINDWLGVVSAVIDTHAQQRRVVLAELGAVSASEQLAVGQLTPPQAAVLQMSGLRPEQTTPNRGVLPVMLCLNWGARQNDAGVRWPELLDMCTRAGHLVHQLVSSTLPAVLCLFLPGRATHDGHTTKAMIGDQNVPAGELPVKDDARLGELRPAYFGATQWVVTQTILTQAALRLRAVDHLQSGGGDSKSKPEFNVDDYVWIAHQPVTPTLALLCIRTWPRIHGRPIRPPLREEWARFTKDLTAAYTAAAEHYSLFLPRVEREQYVQHHPSAETAAEKKKDGDAKSAATK